MPPHRDWSCRPLSLVLGLLVAISANGLAAVGLFDPAEDALTAQRAKLLETRPTGQTVIVEIDARSLAALRSWPWPRRYHAEVVNRLHRAGASIIAFDVDFSARSDSGDEQSLRLQSARRSTSCFRSSQKSSAVSDDAQMLAQPARRGLR